MTAWHFIRLPFTSGRDAMPAMATMAVYVIYCERRVATAVLLRGTAAFMQGCGSLLLISFAGAWVHATIYSLATVC